MKYLIAILVVIGLGMLGCHSNEDTGFQRFVGTQKFGIGQVSSQIVIVIKQQGSTITGGVTPPFSSVLESITNGEITGNTIRFDRRQGNITYRYAATLQAIELQGSFGPLGCIQPSSGEPCPSDSNGSFRARGPGVL